MTILQDPSVRSLNEFRSLWSSTGAAPLPKRPERCPRCLNAHSFWVKGYYSRQAIEQGLSIEIPVPRYICKICELIVSVLFAFLVPYRQFTRAALETAICMYGRVRTSYRALAGELSGVAGDDDQRPHCSQVWRWVGMFAASAQRLEIVVQRAILLNQQEDLLVAVDTHRCPNADKAHTVEKQRALCRMSRAIGLAEALLGPHERILLALQTYLGKLIQDSVLSFTGRGGIGNTPQSMKHVN